MLYHHLDKDKIKKDFIYIIKHRQLALHKFKYYSNFTSDNEIYFYLKQLYKELKNDLYPIQEYPSIIEKLVKLKNIGFSIDLEKYQTCMINKINNEMDISFNILEKFNENTRIYNIISNTYTENLKQSILNKLTYVPQSFFTDKWDNKIITYFKEHKDDFYLSRGFLSHLDIDMIIQKLIKADKTKYLILVQYYIFFTI